jgi:hypothetical protein
MEDFKTKVSSELFNISYDLHLIKKALSSITKDISLNMSYCDIISTILEENGLAERGEIDTLTMDLNDRRESETKKIYEKVTGKLKDISDEQKIIRDLLENSPVKGEA